MYKCRLCCGEVAARYTFHPVAESSNQWEEVRAARLLRENTEVVTDTTITTSSRQALLLPRAQHLQFQLVLSQYHWPPFLTSLPSR